MRMLALYVGPLSIIALGIGLARLSGTSTNPPMDDLTEVRGRLVSYRIDFRTRSGDGLLTTMNLENGFQLRTGALPGGAADQYLRMGVEIRAFVRDAVKARESNRTIKTYGLWIDGHEVESASAAIVHEKTSDALLSVLIPVISIALAFALHFAARRHFA